VSQTQPPRILVTRSEPGASETAARLKTLGYAPIVEPLFAIVPLDVTLPAFDALAFTSANGARQLAVLSTRRDIPVFCVGARTAETARDAGFTNVTSANGDVTALGDLILAQLPAGTHLLHAGNAESRGDLSGRLSAQGIAASFVALFHAEPVAAPGPELARHLGGDQAFDAVLIHSPRAGEILAGMIRAAHRPCPVAAAAISPAAAAPLAGLIQGLATASAPTEDALLSSIASLVSG
jgi:uroporphyrinogen-III synthase